METNFLITEAAKITIYYVVAFVGGLFVRHKGVKTNYTRKVNHFALFFVPMVVHSLFAYEENLVTTVLSFVFGIVSLAIYVKPIRERAEIIRTAFLSFDRPEDRPHTLLWLSTQLVTTQFVLISLIIYLFLAGKMSLLYIPILVNGVGDGLTEPVGVRFGKHTYEAYALFSRKKYVRSFEGSACIFIMSIITVLALHSSFSPNQFIAALISIPVIMTLGEAIAPHSWDSPFLFAVGGLAVFGILQI